MDDDFLVDEEALRLILQLHKEHPNRIYLLNWEYPSDTLGKMKHTQFGRFLVNQQWTSLRGWLRSEHWRDDQPFEIPSGASYFLPLRKDIFEKIGGYNEKFPMAGFEDYDLPKRLMKEGFRFYIYPQKTIYHNESDRGELKAFLARRKRSAITQKVAVDIGYKELAIPYSKSKSTILKGLSALSPALIRTVELIPNHPAFDSIYTKLTNTLITIKIYEGYTHEHIH
jgi:GT2 family glycosyltransferase